MYYQTILQFKKMLLNLSKILDKAVEYSEAKKFDSTILINDRLAPDQFSFTRQIQLACDNAKFIASRLSGKEAPKHEDNEKTIEELKERITKATEYLDSFTTEDFDGCTDRKIQLPFRPGLYLNGEEYFVEFAVPNFYFHVTTAYSILRHNGLNIGKMDYLGSVNFKPLEG